MRIKKPDCHFPVIFYFVANKFFLMILGEGTSAGSELIAYQPSPFSNSLDLNELLSNVGNPESMEQGMEIF
jgi:hypothetical protein